MLNHTFPIYRIFRLLGRHRQALGQQVLDNQAAASTAQATVTYILEDPLLAALELNRPLNADHLKMAIRYREAQISQLDQEIQVLYAALRRLTGLAYPQPED